MEGYGYGDLILPNETLNNILCVKVVAMHTDTYGSTVDEMLVIEYLFLSPDIPNRILSLISFEDITGGGGNELKYGHIMSNYVGLKDEVNSHDVATKVFPNPVNKGEDFNISIESKESRNVNVNVIDVTGKVVNSIGSKSLSIGTNTISVESDRLEAGIYFVKISATNNEFSSTVKMIVK
jgi:hypothetical protein